MKKNAFTLLELMIVLGMVVVLSALVIFGVVNLQRNARDTQRTVLIGHINQEINNFKVIHLRYPGLDEVLFTQTDITIGKRIIPTVGFLASAKVSSTQGTEYYYATSADSFVLCIRLEEGSYQRAGNGNLICPNN